MPAAMTIPHGRKRLKEHRRWPRLTLAIPVFLRGVHRKKDQVLEFTTIINVSIEGILFSSRKSFAKRSLVSLEIPVVLDGGAATLAPRKLQARILRTSHTAVSEINFLRNGSSPKAI